MKKRFFLGNAWKTPDRTERIFLISVVLTLCLAVITRHQLLNGFTLLPGDRYDGVISTMILEHWFRFFSGNANWAEVNYYFPYTFTIANTDAYFLNGVAYSPFRLIGLDPFLSAEFANLAIKATGFVGSYLLCQKVFKLSFYWALLTATLFTLSNGMTAHSSRSQLATVAFTPIMALFIWSAANAFLIGNIAKFRRIGLITGLFFGAWCLSCFYMAWFFTLFFSAFTIFGLVNNRSKFFTIKNKFLTSYKSIIFVSGSAFVGLIPFLYAFVPKSLETGVRLYKEAYSWTVPLEGILQVGKENYFFGKFYNIALMHISPAYSPFGEYYNTGFPIVLFILFLLGCIKTLKFKKIGNNDLLSVSLVIATLLTWMLTLNIFGYSMWYFVFHFFPGAKALRVVSTYQIFLALPVCIVAVKYLSTRRLGFISGIFICSLLIFEEINEPLIGLDRRVELDRISLPRLPPKECLSFYTSGWEGQERLGIVGDIYAHNVSAMFIAQVVNIPTINGIASFNPPDWDFANPNNSNYDKRMLYYAGKHGVSGLCKLDLNSKEWMIVEDHDIQNALINIPFFRYSGLKGRVWNIRGLSSFEPWGTWSSDDVVSFEFNMPLPNRFNILLTAHSFGPNINREFEARVGKNGIKFLLNGIDQKKILEFDNPTGSNTLTFIVPSPTSPKDLGLSEDDRKLGIGFVEVEIVGF